MPKPTFSMVTRELLALHEMFRRLNFDAAELYVCVYADAVHFQLGRDAKFVIDVPNPDRRSPPQVVEEWALALTWWNSHQTSDELRNEVIQGSAFWAQSTAIIAKLVMMGLYLPKSVARA